MGLDVKTLGSVGRRPEGECGARGRARLCEAARHLAIFSFAVRQFGDEQDLKRPTAA